MKTQPHSLSLFGQSPRHSAESLYLAARVPSSATISMAEGVKDLGSVYGEKVSTEYGLQIVD